MNKMEEDPGMEAVYHEIHVAQVRGKARIMVGKQHGWGMKIMSFCKGGS